MKGDSATGPAIWLATGYAPLRWQADNLHAHSERFIAAACGRRAGKTTAVKGEVYREILRPPVMVGSKPHNRLIYIVAPDYELAMRLWEPIWRDFVPDDAPLHALLRHQDQNRNIIDLVNGVRLQAKTGANPKSLAGEPVTLAVVDEAHALEDTAITELLPALADTRGRLIAIGVPQSHGWFRSHWLRGQERDENPDYWSFSVPSTANPYFCQCAIHGDGRDEQCELEVWRDSLPETEFRQLFLAEWAEADGRVFRGIDKCFTGPRLGEHQVQYKELRSFDEYGQESIKTKMASGPYLMGLDLGKLNDFTVAYVIDISTMTVVDRLRVNSVDYSIQVPQIAALYRQYHCQTINMDGTGIGVPILEMLRNEGCIVSSYVFTNESKAQLVGTLSTEIERERVHFMVDDDKLRDELKVFEGTVLPGGSIRYSAPARYHDDCVVAAALAVYKAKKRGTGSAINRGSYVDLGRPGRKPYQRDKRRA